jgi:hypothetical protein
MYNHSFHSTNFLYVHIFLLVLINILKQAAEVQATQPNLNRNQKMFSANSPPHSFHSSNLYNNKDTDVNIVEELSIDPSFWNWKVTESPAWAIVLCKLFKFCSFNVFLLFTFFITVNFNFIDIFVFIL